ncbi:MAG: ABC transporter permease [Deltaproteobacteria bacterium]|nr:ABC transporter permease [Deltaproteobacteria bacterium]
MSVKRAFRVFQRNFTVYKKLYRSSIVLNFVEPVLYLFAFGIGLGSYVKEINGMSYIQFIAPGIIASSSMFASTYECTYGTFVRMNFQKTFDAILSTPVSVYELILGELIWGAFKSVFYGSIIIITLLTVGIVDSALIVFLLPILFVSGFIFAEISMICAALVPGIDSFNYFYTLFMTPMFLFSGIFFPVDVLPHYLRNVASFTPLYHLTNLCRSYAVGKLAGTLPDLLWLVSFALIFLIPPFVLMRKRIIN